MNPDTADVIGGARFPGCALTQFQSINRVFCGRLLASSAGKCVTKIHKEDPEFDPACDPENPKKIKYEDILAAARRIQGTVIRTPCTMVHMSEKLGMDLYFKQEFLQFTGCFKERGVRNTLMAMTDEQKEIGVVSASLGNHGMALAYHSGLMKVPCIIVMPAHVVMAKVTKVECFGAKAVLHGASLAEAKKHAIAICKEKKMLYVNGFDHPNIVEGQGTIAIEVLEQVPNLDAILCPCGGGSLLAGVCVAMKHLKPDVEVYVSGVKHLENAVIFLVAGKYIGKKGVETEHTNSMVESLKKNERICLDIPSTICDGLAVKMVGVNTFHTIKGLVDKMVVVKEDWVARAILHVIEGEKYVLCGAGATTTAAIMAGLFPNLKGKKVVAVCSGGTIGTSILARALERGMGAEGRLIRFRVTLVDRPRGIAELSSLLASIGVIMRDLVPEKTWGEGDIYSMEVKVIAETKGWDQVKELAELIKKHYKEYQFPQMSDHTDKPQSSTGRGPCLAPTPTCMKK